MHHALRLASAQPWYDITLSAVCVQHHDVITINVCQKCHLDISPVRAMAHNCYIGVIRSMITRTHTIHQWDNYIYRSCHRAADTIFITKQDHMQHNTCKLHLVV